MMSERRYTATEIAEMREAIFMQYWSWGQYGMDSAYARADREIQTYIMAGCESAEVISLARSNARIQDDTDH